MTETETLFLLNQLIPGWIVVGTGIAAVLSCTLRGYIRNDWRIIIMAMPILGLTITYAIVTLANPSTIERGVAIRIGLILLFISITLYNGRPRQHD